MPDAFRSFYLVLRRYDDVGGKYLAASLSFFALLSFIPLLFTILNLFGYIIGHIPHAEESVVASFRTIFPGAGRYLSGEIRRVVEHSAVGWFSLILFVWVGTLVFGSLENAMHRIFMSESRRHLLARTGIKVAMVIAVGLMMVGSFWASYLPTLIERFPPLADKFPETARFTGSALAYLMPMAFMSAGLTGIYCYIPDDKVPLTLALKGGVTAALLWELAKTLFAEYVMGFTDFGGVYGPLAAAIVFLLWVYYSASIVLFVALVVSMQLRGEIA